MKRHLKYIFLALFAYAMTISCIEEIPFEEPMGKNQSLVLVPRVTSFANQYVTKAGYSTGETHISRLAVLVFNSDGRLVHMQQNEDGNSFTLNKSMLSSPAQKEKLASSTVVMIANIGLENVKDASGNSIVANKDNLTLDGMEAYSFHFTEGQTVVTDISEDFAGFPMIGGVKGVDLRSTATQSAVEVGLKILYAKVTFFILVDEGTENSLNPTSFKLNGYSVFNASKVTSVAIPTEKGEPVRDFLGNVIGESVSGTEDEATASADYAYKTSGVSGTASGNTNMNENKPLTFTFYVAESRYNHNCNLSAIYPQGWTTTVPAEDVKNYTDADAGKINGVKYFYDDLIQQYKPKLAEVDGASPGKKLATYVLLDGSYTDYRGVVWGVKYKVYLGKDNAQNFHVDRNSEYTNYITIKGIRNNDAYDENQVWVDHRVDVSLGSQPTGTGTADDCVTITRETLIDSHIEVRPLRVKWDEGEYMFARIHLPYYTEDDGKTWVQRDETTSTKKNWIGIEKGDKTGSLYCSGDNNPSKGKRKYFTEALVSELNLSSVNRDIVSDDGQNKFISFENNQCAWIYIDEYWNEASTASNPATQDRKAKIVVEFCEITDNTLKVKNREEYILFQQPLINIDSKYYIENYEEYLHSYDSHDRYNISTSPTDYAKQGLQWGYNTGQPEADRLSKSQFVTKPLSQWIDWTPNNTEAYDFIHAKDVENDESLSGYKIIDKDGNDIDLTKNTGYNFTYSVSANNGISISSMDKMPESAYQYCLSKNKFKEGTDGQDNEMLVRWYVPDVYELSEIFVSEKSPLSNDSYYWSAQSPYTTGRSNFWSADIASEVVDKAQLVSKNGGIVSKPRSEKHRIRCLYNRNGETANMENRTPEGVGGLMKIPMTVKDKGFFDYSPWFTNLGVIVTEYPDTTYRYPMGDTYQVGEKDRDEADEDFGGKVVNGKHYYTKNPLSAFVWADERDYLQSRGYYTLVHEDKWPGLTTKQTTPITDMTILESIANMFGISSICTLSDYKAIQRSKTMRSGKKIESMPSDVNAVSLDHNEESVDNLKIAFDMGTNSSNTPKYEYYNEDGTKALQQKWEKYWNPPTYTSEPLQGDNETFTGSKTTKTLAGIGRETKEKELEKQGYTIVSSKIIEGGKWYLDYPESYYEIIAYLSVTGYQYSSPGGWDNEETALSEKPVSIEPEKPNVDALTFYAGNTFTINCTKPNYYIRSVKVNYNTSKIGDTKYLRFVDDSKPLPGQDEDPLQMSYLDGANGWSKWTSEGEDRSITLRMVISDKPEPSILNLWNPKATHKDPVSNNWGTNEFNYSLIINSLEIRLEMIEPSTEASK